MWDRVWVNPMLIDALVGRRIGHESLEHTDLIMQDLVWEFGVELYWRWTWKKLTTETESMQGNMIKEEGSFNGGGR